MRHVTSLLFGVVLAPVIWFLASLGQFRFLDALHRFASTPDKRPAELVFGAALMLAAGVWLGVLLGSRLSPVGPAVAGVSWLGLAIAFVIDGPGVTGLLPHGPFGQTAVFTLPLQHGYAFAVGVALLVPMFDPARWRGLTRLDELPAEDDPAAAPAETAYAGPGEPSSAAFRGLPDTTGRDQQPNRFRGDAAKQRDDAARRWAEGRDYEPRMRREEPEPARRNPRDR
jgi:hypothetical protein